MKVSGDEAAPGGEFSATGGAVDTDSAAELRRRLDWRFLLPDPSLADVAFVGDEGPLLEALGAVSTPRRLGYGSEGPHPLVVASTVDWPTLRLASSQVAPGGVLYLEIERGSATGPTDPVRVFDYRGRLDARFKTLGLGDFRAYLHWPDFKTCRSIVPLWRPEALRFLLEQRLAPAGAPGVRQWLSGLASRVPPQLWARCFSLVARKCPPRKPSPLVSAISAQLSPWIPPAFREEGNSPEVLVLTPRFQASRHIVFLAFCARSHGPIVVAKTPRRKGDETSLRREAQVLKDLQETQPGGFSSIPRLLALEQWLERPLLIETALHGPLLSPSRIRLGEEKFCERLTSWLIGFHKATRTSPSPPALERLLPSLEQIDRLLPGHPLLAPSKSLVGALPEDLPSVCEHGDLSHPNLVDLKNGEIGVLDWESAVPTGLPASDLFFFLAFVARTDPSRRLGKQSLESRLERAFGAASGWALPHVLRYARCFGLQRGWLPALFAASWIRALGRLATPLGTTESARQWLSSHPYMTGWRYAIEWGKAGLELFAPGKS